MILLRKKHLPDFSSRCFLSLHICGLCSSDPDLDFLATFQDSNVVLRASLQLSAYAQEGLSPLPADGFFCALRFVQQSDKLHGRRDTHHATKYVRGGMMSLKFVVAVQVVVFLAIALGLFFRRRSND